jgi:hypothetical protein
MGQSGDRGPEPEPLRVSESNEQSQLLQRVEKTIKRRPRKLDPLQQLGRRQLEILRRKRQEDLQGTCYRPDVLAFFLRHRSSVHDSMMRLSTCGLAFSQNNVSV